MRNLVRSFLSMALLALVLFVATGTRAQADLGAPDLAVMQQLANTPGWSAVFGWDPNTNPCPTSGQNWNGVLCIRGRVNSINLSCNSQFLNGPLPPILGQLTELSTLAVIGCGLNGSIPDIFAGMTNLSVLQLNNNTLTGAIPESLTVAPQLSYLILSGNLLTGAIPTFPNNWFVETELSGNFLTSIPDSWTEFDRDIQCNCYTTISATCQIQVPYTGEYNICTPNRVDCPATLALTKVSGDGQWTAAKTNFPNSLIVSVADLSGNPLAGVTVTFSGPGITSTTAISDSNGQASAMVQANSTVGGNTVTVSAGATPMVTFGLTAGDTVQCSTNIAVTNNAASGPGSLQDALADVCPGGTVDLTPIAGQTIALSAGAQSYNFNGRLYIATDVTIQGAGVAINGGAATRIFFVENGNVTLNNLTLMNGVGEGGTSQVGGSAGGLGGAIFQNNGNLTLKGVALTGNQAVGGSPDTSGSVTGGSFGGGSSSGDLGGTAGPGDGAGGVSGIIGGQGGFGAGGGQGTTAFQLAIADGGSGGFAGGGGWASTKFGWSGYPGYGGSLGNSSGVGGSGAGFGGAVFVRSGNLNLANVTFSNNSAVGGTGAQGKGGALFMYNGANLNMVPNTVRYTGDVAAAAGLPGQGYSGDPYNSNNTCPGVDTVDVCGIVPSNTLTAAVSGGGSIADATGLINCPGVNCSALFQTSATLTAVPAVGSYFTGWSGGGCSGTGTCTVSLAGGSALVTASFTAIGAISATSGTPQSAMTGTQFANPLVVTVSDINNNPVPGATVVFTAPGSGASATLSSPTATNAAGQTSVTATANSTPGSYMVTASVSGVAGTANFSLTNFGALASLQISGGNNQSAPLNAAFATNLQVTATDSSGDPVSGVQVTFTANPSPDGASGTFAGSNTNVDTEFTNGAGVAQASVLTANAIAGKFTVTATAGALSQTFTLTNGSASSISLLASPLNSVLSQPVTLTATITPNTATGNVTFYDGTNILGIAPVSNGIATLTTPFLPADGNPVTALYDGGGPYAPVLSTVQNTMVTPYNSPSLGAAVTYPAGNKPAQVIAADFNGDGIADLLILNQTDNTFSVLLGKGDGTFAAALTSATANGPINAAVGDFNGDGKVDVAIAENGAAGVTVFLGNGDGTFQMGTLYPLTGAMAVAVADFNGDGFADLVAVGNGIIEILLGAGDGTFHPLAANQQVSGQIITVMVGDFNNDGIPDLAVANSSSRSVSVLSGNGDGTLQSPVSYTLSAVSGNLAAGHFFSTANLDIAVTSGFLISLLAGNGDGTFQSPMLLVLPQEANSLATGDFNGDGVTDLAAGGSNGSVFTLLGQGQGAFAPPVFYPSSGNVSSIVTADFNGDGRMDVATVNSITGQAAVMLGTIPGEAMAKTAGDGQSAVAGTAFATNLQVTITDGSNNPVPNMTVTFTGPASGASGTFAGGVNTAITNASGVATAPVFTANQKAGGYQVTAGAPGVTAVNFSLANNTAAPANIAPTSGGGQSANVNTAFASPLTVTVTDTYGNPVSGATVTYTPPAQSGASVTFAGGINTASTNANGVATSAAISANGVTGGPYQVVASVNSVSTSFSLTNLSSTTSLSLAPVTGTSLVNTKYTLTATATGVGNVPISGTIVNFAVTAGPNAGVKGSGQTNGSGQATFAYTGSAPGVDTIAASTGTVNSNTVTVTWQAAPAITWATPAAITYGTPLGSKQLDATANVPGKFVYTPAAGTVLTAGSHQLSVEFTPSNTTLYASVSATVNLQVNQATPIILWLPIPIVYGTPLGILQLDALADVKGAFVYTPPAGTILTPGNQPLSAVFTPGDTVDYKTVTVSATLLVTKALPVITWKAPEPITVGTALGAGQLDATANVPGTFTYTPPTGTKLGVGTWNLTVSFVPQNASLYTNATAVIQITVKPN